MAAAVNVSKSSWIDEVEPVLSLTPPHAACVCIWREPARQQMKSEEGEARA